MVHNGVTGCDILSRVSVVPVHPPSQYGLGDSRDEPRKAPGVAASEISTNLPVVEGCSRPLGGLGLDDAQLVNDRFHKTFRRPV